MQFSVYETEVFVRERLPDSASIALLKSRGNSDMLSFQDNYNIHNDDPFLKQKQPVYDLRIRRILDNIESEELDYEEVSNLATMSFFDTDLETTEIRFQGHFFYNTHSSFY